MTETYTQVHVQHELLQILDNSPLILKWDDLHNVPKRQQEPFELSRDRPCVAPGFKTDYLHHGKSYGLLDNTVLYDFKENSKVNPSHALLYGPRSPSKQGEFHIIRNDGVSDMMFYHIFVSDALLKILRSASIRQVGNNRFLTHKCYSAMYDFVQLDELTH